MFKCTVPYRRYKKKYGKPYLTVSQEYKKLIKHIQKASIEGKEVNFEHIVLNDGKTWHVNKWYDKVTVTINA